MRRSRPSVSGSRSLASRSPRADMRARSSTSAPTRRERFSVIEVDGEDGAPAPSSSPVNRLADAIVRLYERHAELLPDGGERERAALMARSGRGTPTRRRGSRSLRRGARPRDRVSRPSAARVRVDAWRRAVPHRVRSIPEVATDFATHVDDLVSLRSHGLVVRWTQRGTARSQPGAIRDELSDAVALRRKRPRDAERALPARSRGGGVGAPRRADASASAGEPASSRTTQCRNEACRGVQRGHGGPGQRSPCRTLRGRDPCNRSQESDDVRTRGRASHLAELPLDGGSALLVREPREPRRVAGAGPPSDVAKPGRQPTLRRRCRGDGLPHPDRGRRAGAPPGHRDLPARPARRGRRAPVPALCRAAARRAQSVSAPRR